MLPPWPSRSSRISIATGWHRCCDPPAPSSLALRLEFRVYRPGIAAIFAHPRLHEASRIRTLRDSSRIADELSRRLPGSLRTGSSPVRHGPPLGDPCRARPIGQARFLKIRHHDRLLAWKPRERWTSFVLGHAFPKLRKTATSRLPSLSRPLDVPPWCFHLGRPFDGSARKLRAKVACSLARASPTCPGACPHDVDIVAADRARADAWPSVVLPRKRQDCAKRLTPA